MAKEKQMQMQDIEKLVEKYHKALPKELRTYLNQRGLSDKTIDKFGSFEFQMGK